MIYDCFQFFNELDMLKIRLNVMSPIVDKFVISEATETFSGLKKPLYYEENKEMFAEFADKIIHVVVDTRSKYGKICGSCKQYSVSKRNKFSEI